MYVKYALLNAVCSQFIKQSFTNKITVFALLCTCISVHHGVTLTSFISSFCE